MTQADFRHSVESAFRNASDDLDMTPGKVVVIESDPNWDYTIFCLKVVAGFLIAVATLISIGVVIGRATASEQSKDQRAISKPAVGTTLSPESIDFDFDRYVEKEIWTLCKFGYRLGRESMFPSRVLVCDKGRG